MAQRVLALVVMLSIALGHEARGQAVADTGGVQIGLRLNGSAWTVNDLDVDTESGIGLALLGGYGISDHFAVYADLTLASIDAQDTYGLGHLDAGIRFYFGGPADRFRPYADAALSGRRAEWDDPALGHVEAWGVGGTAGGGFLYFLSGPAALDVGFKTTFGGLNEVTIGGTSREVDIRATSARLNVGFTLFLNR
jgi:hypothetical protein